MGRVLAGRLAQRLVARHRIADIVGDLIGFAQPLADQLPGGRRRTSRERASQGGRGEEGAGLFLLINRKVGTGLTLPGLTRNDTVRYADTIANRHQHRPEALRRHPPASRQQLKSEDNQGVPSEDRQRLAEGDMHRRLAAAGRRIVKAGQIVMHQRCAVQQFDRGGRAISQRRPIIAAGSRNREAEPRANPGAAGEDGIAHGLGQARRTSPLGGQVDRLGQGPFDARHGVHGHPRCLVSLPLELSAFVDAEVNGKPCATRRYQASVALGAAKPEPAGRNRDICLIRRHPAA